MRVFCNFLIVRCRDFAPYYGGSDADARGENLENLRAMLAESDDDEELPS